MGILVGGLALIVFQITRWGLLVTSGTGLVPWELWPSVLLKGAWFDVLVAGVWAAPFVLYDAAVPNRWRRSARHRPLRFAVLWTFISFLLFTAVLEIAFWAEFSTRLNFISVDYLLYTHEVIGNLRQSYPLGWIFFSIGLTAAGTLWSLRARVIKIDARPISRRRRLGESLFGVALPLFAVLFGNLDQMSGLGNSYAEELSGNGFWTFAAALRRNELDYDAFYPTLPQKEADDVLAALRVERSPLSELLVRDMNDAADDRTPFHRRPRHVVLISVESLSASFVGAYGSERGLTPNIDRLAREGLLFRRVYATGTRTVRGLEALSLGTPPVPGQSIVRRPHNDHLATIGEILRKQGFATMFFYGGRGYFDNMNAYFSGNDYEIIDRPRFPKDTVVFENAWGVADETLYANALTTLRRIPKERPFFAHIMTTSNHRPFTYPDGRVDIPSPGGRDGAVKYTDFAIGEFVSAAEKESWFYETLFVITADHCASAAGKTKLPLEKYRIPLIFYAPRLLDRDVFEPMVSQIDLLPSLVEVLGKRGDDHFFGRSFFEGGPPLERAFISNYQSLGYVRDGFLTVLLPQKRAECFRLNPIPLDATPTPLNTRLFREAVAYYQTAARAFKSGALRLSE
ncbi:MAG: LTA synthase family protein [Elusimicrobia bacterium]|nr:LTA synthase family protein [Elusimicrobiota bacterium]MBK7208015.1 LTA synthase family protein [Elusimicrobiota bacterium]MBK7544793.1 LTA synthase family protein [Elusimicrobiota bacterium]MBK7574305.1 LTA synthase family protein [Elusimicrobiota bacterium]MBK8126452.1 LTA synthase family protein [Elusimicrobiota bacterium]